MRKIFIAILIIISTDIYSQRIPFGFWSNPRVDTLELEAPLLLYPADDTTGMAQSPLLDWDGVVYATGYIVQLSDTSIFTSIAWSDTTGNSKATVELGLTRGSDWYWRVKAYNIFDTSEWSTTFHFTVTTGPALTSPVLVYPGEYATEIPFNPVLDWDSVINADYYKVDISASTNFSSLYWSDTVYTTTATVGTALNGSTQYYWRVIAENPYESKSSDTGSFTTRTPALAAPTLVTPANAATGQSQSPTLVWRRVTNAEFYNVQLTQYDDFSSILLNVGTFDTTKLVYMTLLEGTKWYWRIRAINATDTGSWSSTYSFAVTEGSATARAYYVDPESGKDEYNGRSTSTAWKTITKVNAKTLIAGDTIKFKGGETYSDAVLTVSQSGSSLSVPIVYTSYGGTKAIISAAANTNGIYAADVQYVTFRNLKITSTFNPYSQGGVTQNGKAGINLANNYNGQKAGIRIDSCYISKFNGLGIFVHSYSGDSTIKGGYRDLQITNCTIDSIGHFGIYVTYAKAGTLWYGTGSYPNSNITVKKTTVSNVTGIINNNPYTGTGILFSDIDTSLVDSCIVANCGSLAVGYSAGPGGFDAVRSNRITVQHSEVYGQQTGGYDGNGIHFDDGVTNSTAQYNYTHNNEGTGISVYSFSSGYPRSDSNNVIRYNICQNNGTGGSTYNGDITVRGNGRVTYAANVYNNTIYTTSAHTDTVSSGIVLQGSLTNTYVRNNAIITGDTYSKLMDIVTGTYSGMFVQGNLYWNTSGSFKLRDSGTTYTSYNYWQAAHTSREKLSSVNVGAFLNPQFNNPGGGGTIGNTAKLDTMSAYKTAGASATKDRGLNIDSLFSFNVGTVDYYGTTLRQNNKFDIGAYENPDSYVWQDSTKMFIGKSISPPTVSRQYMYDSLYLILQRDSLLRDTRALYIYSTSDTNLALRNIKLDSITSIRNGTMTFVADSGFTGDGASGVIKTQINPSTQAYGIFTAQNCGLGIYVLNNSLNTVPDISAVNGAPWFSLRVRGTSETTISGLNSGSELSIASADTNSKGFFSNFRQTDSLITFKNKSRRNYSSKFTDSTVVNYPINIGALSNAAGTSFVTWSTHKYGSAWIGNNMSTYRQGKLTEAIDWWMRRVNISVIPPYAATLLTPANGEDSVSVTPTLDWDTIANASTYHVQVDDNSDFSSLTGEITGLTNSRYIVGGSNPGATGSVTIDTNEVLYWRVRGESSIGNGTWSSTFTFSTFSTYETESISLFARFPNGVGSVARKDLIDSLVKYLKADTIWTNLDVLYLFAAEDTGQANANWIGSSYTATRPGSTKPTLARDSGYTGDGSAGYVNLNWAPSSGTSFTQNSACYGVFVRTNVGEAGFVTGSGNAGTNFDRFNPRNASNIATYSINESSQPTVSNTDSRGLFAINRSGSSATQLYKNGVSISTNSGASTGRSTVNMLVCAINANGSIANYSTRQISMFFAGASMSAYRQSQFYKRIEWYLNRLGSCPFVPSAPTLVSPANSGTGISTSTNYDWSDVGANYYQIEIDDDIAFGSPYYTANCSGSAEFGDNIGSLANNTTYYWRVRGVNNIGTGSWSSTYSFTTTP